MSNQRIRVQFLVVALVAASVILTALFTTLRAVADAPGPGRPQLAQPLGSGFTYQGLIKKNGVPVNGSCSFQFGLWDQASGGLQIGLTQTVAALPVVNGLLTAPLNTTAAFGAQAFNGERRFLNLAVQCSDDVGFTVLGRQELTPAPYAFALPGLRTEPNATSPNIIGGLSANHVVSGVVGATISGGGAPGFDNIVTDDFGTVGGGQMNSAGNSTGTTNDGELATVGGGDSNAARGRLSTIAGGQDSNANGDYAFVGGGGDNDANGFSAVVGGGTFNHVTGQFGAIGGGYSNNVSGLTATIPGGSDNVAGGNFSFAAGRHAQANHNGAFVWADGSTAVPFASDRADQFKIKAAGGAIISASASSGLNPAALQVQSGGANGAGIYVTMKSSDAALVLENAGAGDYIKAFGGITHTLRFRVDQVGNVTADGTYTSPAADFAEMLPGAADLEPGDVLVIGPDGRVARSTQPNASAVVGVYSTQPGFVGGGTAAAGNVPLAVVGVVPVKASAENGAIRPGDLLVSAGRPGYAMRAGLHPAVGTVIGKALAPLANGQGLIKMLVTLQ